MAVDFPEVFAGAVAQPDGIGDHLVKLRGHLALGPNESVYRETHMAVSSVSLLNP
jgi:hypothetical protein